MVTRKQNIASSVLLEPRPDALIKIVIGEVPDAKRAGKEVSLARLAQTAFSADPCEGEVPEWLNGAVSKTVVRASVPRVRIPLSPPH